VEGVDGETLGNFEGAVWGRAVIDAGGGGRVDDLRSVEDHRDVKAVHGDITALLAAGILDRTAAGEIEFPFDAVKVEFLLQAA
jgi:hypothetical protein